MRAADAHPSSSSSSSPPCRQAAVGVLPHSADKPTVARLQVHKGHLTYGNRHHSFPCSRSIKFIFTRAALLTGLPSQVLLYFRFFFSLFFFRKRELFTVLTRGKKFSLTGRAPLSLGMPFALQGPRPSHEIRRGNRHLHPTMANAVKFKPRKTSSMMHWSFFF